VAARRARTTNCYHLLLVANCALRRQKRGAHLQHFELSARHSLGALCARFFHLFRSSSNSTKLPKILKLKLKQKKKKKSK